jgi:transcriptional antiterminator NusG
MDMTDDAYHLVKNTPKVTGFLGSGKRPLAVPEGEVKRIMGQMEEDAEKPRPTVTFDIGETVRVTDGHFQSFNGIVEDVDDAKGLLKVAINIFGRATPVELEYGQVEKAS